MTQLCLTAVNEQKLMATSVTVTFEPYVTTYLAVASCGIKRQLAAPTVVQQDQYQERPTGHMVMGRSGLLVTVGREGWSEWRNPNP